MNALSRSAAACLLALPGALAVYFAFNAGGFFAGAPAAVAALMAVLLAARIAFGVRPLEGIGAGAAAVIGALTLYAIWVLLSGTWSDAPARAVVEFDRALLYVLTFVLFASVARRPGAVSWIVRGLAAGLLAVCLAALITRVAPDVWPIALNARSERLSYPLTYWNALGLMAAIAIALCLHLSASLKEHVAVRLLGAAAVPVLAATLTLTFSRGAIAAAVVAVVVYCIAGRPSALPSALLAVVGPTVAAVVAAYGADRVSAPGVPGRAAVEQGHSVAVLIAICALVALALRALLLGADRRWLLMLPSGVRERGRLSAAVAILATLVVTVVGGLLLGAPAELDRQYDRFTAGYSVPEGKDVNRRLTSASNNGRLDHWHVALDDFRAAPLVGDGAGTFQVSWARERTRSFTVADAHSLYVENLGELGLVGAVLLIGALVAILGGMARRIGPPERAAHAAAFAAVLVWALHAGIDWDWELPAVTVWVFALAGAVMAVAPGEAGGVQYAPGLLVRAVAAVAVLTLAVLPATMAISQRQLNQSVEALKRRDCGESLARAQDALDVMPIRPEPWEVRGYCLSRLGQADAASQSLMRAVDRDPDNWEFRYGLGLVRGAAGRDPRPALREAARLNPREALVRDAVLRFRGDDPAVWRRQGRLAKLPLTP